MTDDTIYVYSGCASCQDFKFEETSTPLEAEPVQLQAGSPANPLWQAKRAHSLGWRSFQAESSGPTPVPEFPSATTRFHRYRLARVPRPPVGWRSATLFLHDERSRLLSGNGHEGVTLTTQVGRAAVREQEGSLDLAHGGEEDLVLTTVEEDFPGQLL